MNIDAFRTSLQEDFKDQFRRVEESFGKLTSDQLMWRPDEKTWSVGECLHHMWITNDKFLAGLSMAVRESDHKAKENQDYESNWMGRRFMSMIGPEGGENTPVPKPLIPHRDHVPESIVQLVLDQIVGFDEFLMESAKTDLARTKMRSPLMPIIRLQLGDVFKSLCLHNERHIRQAARLTRLSGFAETAGAGSASAK